jgi:hypothetical protein
LNNRKPHHEVRDFTKRISSISDHTFGIKASLFIQSGNRTASQDVLLIATPPLSLATSINCWKLCINWAVTNLTSAYKRKEGRAGKLEAIERPQCWLGRSDADVRGEVGYTIGRNRRYVIR